MAEERVFSHSDLYTRAKMGKSDKKTKIVHHIHGVIGDEARKWVLGILS